MKPSSAKAKGREGQKEVVQMILDAFPDLKPDDVLWRSMGAQGEDIMLSPEARSKFPFSVEVKRTEKFNAYAALEQAAANNRGDNDPVVFARKNKTEWVVVLYAEDFMDLVSH